MGTSNLEKRPCVKNLTTLNGHMHNRSLLVLYKIFWIFQIFLKHLVDLFGFYSDWLNGNQYYLTFKRALGMANIIAYFLVFVISIKFQTMIP